MSTVIHALGQPTHSATLVLLRLSSYLRPTSAPKFAVMVVTKEPMLVMMGTQKEATAVRLRAQLRAVGHVLGAQPHPQIYALRAAAMGATWAQ